MNELINPAIDKGKIFPPVDECYDKPTCHDFYPVDKWATASSGFCGKGELLRQIQIPLRVNLVEEFVVQVVDEIDRFPG